MNAESNRKTLIVASKGCPSLELDEVWRARELMWMFALRDIHIRYRQTVLGMAWAVIQPLMLMIVFAVMFGKVGKFPSENLPYPVFCFTGLLLWQYFVTSVTNCSNSLVNNPQLLTKVYFPRLVLPLANLIPPAVDMCVSIILLVAMIVWNKVPLSPHLVYIPVFALLALLVTLGVSLWLSALCVKYRDVKYLTPFLLMIWMYLTPVAYPLSMIPKHLKLLYSLNPMAWAVEGMRAALFGCGKVDILFVAASFCSALVLTVSGAFYFRLMERSFAEKM